MANRRLSLILPLLAVIVGAGLLLLGPRLKRGGPAATPPALVTHQRTVPRVMSTVATLTVVAEPRQAAEATQTLDEIEAVLRGVEARMSVRLADSELSRLNAAPVGQATPLSPPMREVLERARDFAGQSRGAFDVTCRPILEMWRLAGQRQAAPSPREISQAVESTGWRWFELTEAGGPQTPVRAFGGPGLVRKREGASIDLGGIGKKYAIDRAAEVVLRRRLPGGMINVGGDIRCVGRKDAPGPWRIGVRNPFSNDPGDLMAVIAIEQGSVCTSGNYERFVELGGRRYSHIVDPRTGMPCDNAPSVTVVGPDATTAGLWATALSVLGVEGLKLMPRQGTPPPAGLEVMMVVGRTASESRWYRTAGLDRLLVEPGPPQPPTELPAEAATTSAPATPLRGG